MKRVLFICMENSARSQMAEALLENLSKGGVKAMSAGTKPSSSVNKNAVKAMKEIGIDISRKKPKLLTFEMIEKADKVILMGCVQKENVASVCPAAFVKDSEDWKIKDPSEGTIEDFRKVRDDIKGRVLNLLKELEVDEVRSEY